MLASHSVQECMDLAGVAHLAAIKGSLPFIHFFDGFRTSHEIQKVEVMDQEFLKSLVDMDAVAKFKANALNPHTNPVTRGGAENDDIYFPAREAANGYYEAIPDIVNDYMQRFLSIQEELMLHLLTMVHLMLIELSSLWVLLLKQSRKLSML